MALAAKNIRYEYIPVHLLKGEQFVEDHLGRNPMAQVPVLECTDSRSGRVLQIFQSLAIIDFLEEAFEDRGGSLLPNDIITRAFARELAEIINSGTQPHSNLSRIVKIEADSDGKIKGKDISKEAMEHGLRSIGAIVTNKLSASAGGPFACGTFFPTIADACVVPQMYNARRLGVDLDAICPALVKVEQNCLKHPWFVVSHPEKQKDAVFTD